MQQLRSTTFSQQRSLDKVVIIIPNPTPDSPSSPNPAPSRPIFPLAKLFPQPGVQLTPLVRRSQSCIQVPATLPHGNVTIFLEVIRRTNFSLRPARAQRTRGEPSFGLGGRIRYEVRLRRFPRRALCSIGRNAAPGRRCVYGVRYYNRNPSQLVRAESNHSHVELILIVSVFSRRVFSRVRASWSAVQTGRR